MAGRHKHTGDRKEAGVRGERKALRCDSDAVHEAEEELLNMKQDQIWLNKYQEVVTFIETNKRNPSKHDDEERGRYCNWLKHNRKLYAAGEMKEERRVLFEELMELGEKYKRVNQWA